MKSLEVVIQTSYMHHKLYRELDNTSPNFEWYVKNTSIHELRNFGCDIYPIKLSPKKLDDITK